MYPDIQAHAREEGRGERTGRVEVVGRAEVTLEGVEEVINFDAELVSLKSVDGELYIEGENMKIGELDTKKGRLTLCGEVDALYYRTDRQKAKKGYFGRRRG